MKSFKIALGSDHAGFATKEFVKEFLVREGNRVDDAGTHSDQSVDYPDFSHEVANRVTGNASDFGILFCGSGNGVAIAANRHKHIRAALCWTPEVARLARLHNDANVLCIPARCITNQESLEITRVFLETAFEGGRHARRVEKIEIP
jgi:ribose 5-phosphate isomerase B